MADPAPILVLSHDAGIGGAQRSLLDALAGLNPQHFKPIILVPTPGPFVSAARARGFRCVPGLILRWIFFTKARSLTPSGLLGWLLHPWLLASISALTLPLRLIGLTILCKLWRVRLIYTNTATVIDGAILAYLLKLPHVWHLREKVSDNSDLSFPFSVEGFPDFVLSHATTVIVTSSALRKDYFGAGPNDKIRIIWNGMDLPPRLDSPPAAIPGVPASDTPATAICCRLLQRKRVDVYLTAMAIVSRACPAAQHLVIGDGPERHRLEHLATNLGLDGKVHFLGYRDDANLVMARASVLVSTADHEGFGRTLIEAMAAGVPVVATRSGGPQDIVLDGETGFLVNIGDHQKIADRVLQILEDHGLARHLSEGARRRAKQQFSLSRYQSEVASVLYELFPNSPPGPRPG